ncbi:MAG: response regulator transcription factor [Nonomuraea sp.]|nr:response regulator transcription factor [Nonomuraea sp.]
MRLLIVDDHRGFRSGLRALLASAPGIEVLDEAGSGEQALALLPGVQPDVVLMDLTMPGMGGIEATRRITAASPHVRVLVLSMSEDDDSVLAALRAGARGYVLKGARRGEILRSVRAVAEGEAIFGAAIANRLAGLVAAGQTPAGPAFPELTEREREILALVARHLTNPEIATRLSLSEKTVRNNVSVILTKLGVADRAQAIMRARAAGL